MIVYEAISPHPPIIIPEIGQDRIKGVAEATVEGMRRMAEAAVRADPETVIIISPHTNIFADAVSYLSAEHLEGSLAGFGFRSIGSSRDNDLEMAALIKQKATEAGITFVGIGPEFAGKHRLNSSLDHGVLVPMYYLEKAGLKPAVRLMTMGYGYLDRLSLYKFGRLIRESAEELGRRCVIIASGDMSHRLKDEGPYSYHPDGPRFDAEIARLVSEGQALQILDIDEELRENAGECGFNSMLIMLGTLDGKVFASELYSYEGPFGVGYLTAGFHPGAEGQSILDARREQEKQQREEIRQAESAYVRWARMILENYVQTREKASLPDEWAFLREQKSAVFVSLKKHGQLRGCIGTFAPSYDNLAEEIAENALAAGMRDPRFRPVRQDELDSLVYSVDLLSDPEPCTRDGLDPRKYGVIVSSGSRRGLLLPDLEGVDTVDQQLAIALQKAGIKDGKPYDIQRFEVRRFK